MNAYRLLVGKPEEKRQLGRKRCKWVDNISMDLRQIGWSGLDGKLSSGYTIGGFLSSAQLYRVRSQFIKIM
jgi:hypothetical protein